MKIAKVGTINFEFLCFVVLVGTLHYQIDVDHQISAWSSTNFSVYYIKCKILANFGPF